MAHKMAITRYRQDGTFFGVHGVCPSFNICFVFWFKIKGIAWAWMGGGAEYPLDFKASSRSARGRVDQMTRYFPGH